MARDGRPDLAGQRDERVAGPGDDPDADADAVVADADATGRAGEERAPGRPAAADAGDARDLEGGEADQLGDDAAADGQLRAAHDADSRRGSSVGVRRRPSRRRGAASARPRRTPRR